MGNYIPAAILVLVLIAVVFVVTGGDFSGMFGVIPPGEGIPTDCNLPSAPNL